MRKIAIITGGSKGIGNALCKKYIENGYTVFSIARSANTLKSITHIPCDMSKSDDVENTFTKLLTSICQSNISHIILINNAGTLGTIAPLELNTTKSITDTLQVNLTSVLQTTSLFIKYTKQLNCSKKIINISSGAAISPYEGWSAYCSSKAGVDMLTKVVAKEQEQLKNGVHIIGIYPGVVDTQMQNTIRKTPKENFKMLDKFERLHTENLLFSPDFVANTIFKIDQNNLVKNGEIIDIRDLNLS